MGYDYSVSLQGLHNAEQRLERAAKNIARVPASADSGKPSEPADSFTRTETNPDAGPDYAAELVQILQARTHARANLRALKLGDDLQEETLDLLG
jgi:flagellar basal body rod protein FlgC